MAGVGSHNKAFGVEVGAVDEDLVVDSLLINTSGWLDKPERCEASLQSSWRNTAGFSGFYQAVAGGEPGNEKAEPFGLHGIVIHAGEGGLAGAASPSLAPSTRCSVFRACPAADGASRMIFTHPLIVNLGA